MSKQKGKYARKNDYLFKSFAKQKQSKENYIINAVYSRINNKELKPVTQQCIRIGKKYRKIDLFFPQLNIGIECDEAYHKKRKDKDAKRTIEIKDKLNAVVLNKKEYKQIRIDATLDYDKLFEKINQVANQIKKKCRNIKWESHEETLKRIKKGNVVKINDNITYKTHDEVCELFDIKARPRRGGEILNDNYHIWFPKLAIKDENGKWKAKDKKWNNKLSEDWKTIIETTNKNVRRKRGKNDNYWKTCKRLTFAKTKDLEGTTGYRFIGVFKYVCEDGETRIYNKLSDKFVISKVLKG